MKLLCFLLVLSAQLVAQLNPNNYDTDLLGAKFHADRRDALRAKMDVNSVAVVFANPIHNRNNDVDFKYCQNSDFYYLTGLTEPDAVVLIFKDQIQIDSITTNEIIYVQPRNPSAESWTGRRLGIEGSKKNLGFSYVYNNSDFADLSLDFKKFLMIYHNQNFNDARDDSQDKGDVASLWKYFDDKTVGVAKNAKSDYKFNTMLAALREIKTKEELVLLKKAIDITCDAHLDLMKCIDTNYTEYKAQALVEFGFTFNGSEYQGYPSIVGGAENSCILHYTENRRKLENKDFLVVDAGAEYHGYTADVTRTLPVNGKFSEEQKKIYNLVLEAQLAGIKACKKGAGFREPHNEAVKVIQKGLQELGITKGNFEYMKYFNHGTSHYLGIDVHDPGLYGPLKPNQVITVEPGIYIPAGSNCDPKWWNIGVRIEDDVLITEGEPDVLSGKLPKTVEEIEKVMKLTCFFTK